jgi:hypothetical protein
MHETEASSVPAWAREVRDKAALHRIADKRHDDGNRPGCLLSSSSRWRCDRHEDINVEPDELGSELREALVSTVRPSLLEGDALAFHVAEVAKSLPEDIAIVLRRRVRTRARTQKTYSGHLRRLRVAGPRRGEECAGARDELTSIHYSITPGLPNVRIHLRAGERTRARPSGGMCCRAAVITQSRGPRAAATAEGL